jgi:hypothetical protein
MKNLKTSQEFMIFAYIVVFIAQFFTFGYSSYYYTTSGGGFTLTNEAKVEQSGWDYHAWWAVLIIMAVVLYSFFTRSPKVGWYWVAAVVCLILGLGNFWGLAAIGLAGYSVYRKIQENKAGKTRA